MDHLARFFLPTPDSLEKGKMKLLLYIVVDLISSDSRL